MDAVALIGIVLACIVVAGGAAGTAWRFDLASRRSGGIDDYFWIAFGGGVVVCGAAAAAASFGGASAAAVVVAVSAPTACSWAWLHHRQRMRLAEETARVEYWADLRRRHDTVVSRWADYDVDPAKAIAYPGMHSPTDPVGKALVRALRAAGAERDAREDPATGATPAARRYEEAVVRLEGVFDAAEREVRARHARVGARHRAVPGRL